MSGSSFLALAAAGQGKMLNKSIALSSSVYHVNLSAGIGIYGLSKNRGIDIEFFLHLI